MADAQSAIAQAAAENGVPLMLALAIAQVESGLNPNAIGDNGHSVGLYQLNDQGEGAGMSVAQRQDPLTNARVALARVGAVYRANPGLDWGQIAAAAQRPANQQAYAARVDAAVAQYGSALGQLHDIATLGGQATLGPTAPNPGPFPLDLPSALYNATTGPALGFWDGIKAATSDAGIVLRNSAVGLAAGVFVVLILFGRDNSETQ